MPVFKTGATNPQGDNPQSLPANADSVLAFCLAHFSAVDPDLALVLEHWPALSATAKTALVAMVKATASVANKATKGTNRK